MSEIQINVIANTDDAVSGINDVSDALKDLTPAAEEADSSSQDLGETTKETTKGMGDFGGGIDKTIEKLTGLNASTLTAGGSLLLITNYLKDAVNGTEDYALSIERLDILTGQSSESTSALVKSMELVGISAQEAQSAFEFALRKGIDPTQAGLETLADKLNAIQDPVERDKILIQDFGRYLGPDMARYLAEGSQGIQDSIDKVNGLGDTMTGRGITDANSYEESLGTLNQEISAISKNIGGVLIPILNDSYTAWQPIITTINELVTDMTGYQDIMNQHNETMINTATSYDAYTTEMNRAAAVAGEYIDEQGNLAYGDDEILVKNFLLTQSQFDVSKSQRESNAALQDYLDMHDENIAARQTSTTEINNEATALIVGSAAAEAMKESNDAVTLSYKNLASEIKGDLGATLAGYNGNLLDLNQQADTTYKQILALEDLPYLTPAQQTQLSTLETAYQHINAQIVNSGTEEDKATAKIIFDIMQQQLAASGLTGQAMIDAQKAMTQYAENVGLIDSSTKYATDNFDTFLGLVESGKETWSDMANWMAEHPATGTVTIDFLTNGYSDWMGAIIDFKMKSGFSNSGMGMYGTGSTSPIPGGATGLSWDVPGGYPNDTALYRASSGEHVDITPAGQKAKGGATIILNQNFYGNPDADMVKQAAGDGVYQGALATGLI